jgi:Restriction endonuclease
VGRFDALSPQEFEELAADLLSVHLGVRFRIGPPGRDGGADGFYRDAQGEHVLQCKHYRHSSYSKLLAEVRREATAFRRPPRGMPASYRLVTSQRLTHANRDELAAALAGLVSSPDDVLGESDIERLLAEHSEVEVRHPKLWLSSGAQLHRLLTGESYARAEALSEDIAETLPLWVETGAFAQGRALLDRDAVCVIAGPPGIGKTTLARLLVLDGIRAGYQPVEIVQGELAAAWRLLDWQKTTGREVKLMFLFDDFLGQTALLEQRGSDSDLLKFLRVVARGDNARLVLATREYILRDARRASEVLGHEPALDRRLVLTLPSYTREQRARILFNHLWHSTEVDDTAIASLRADRSYLEIVDHPAYSPRVIEWMTGHAGRRLGAHDRSNYARFCINALDHPDELWDHAFSAGLDEAERALVISLIGLPARVDEPTLGTAFEAACAARDIDTTDRRFQRALRVLDDSFISSRRDGDTTTFSALNPSLVDFLLRFVSSSGPDARLAVLGAAFFEQVIALFDGLQDDPALMAVLLPDFAAAFARTFSSSARRPEPRSINQMASEHEHDMLDSVGGRVEALQRRAERHVALLPLIDSLVRDQAARSVASMPIHELIDYRPFVRMKRFIAAGLIDAHCTALTLLDKLDDGGLEILYELSFYDAVDSVRSLDPSAVTAERWNGYQQSAADWVREVLDDPMEVIDDGDDLRRFREVIAAFAVPVDEDEVDAIGRRLTELEEEAMEHRLDDEYERWREERAFERAHPSAPDSDRSLERLFDRLD